MGYTVKRLIRRIAWKLFPKSTEEKKAALMEYEKQGIYPQALTINKTIDLLLQKDISISRFGDGEFNLAMGRSIGFQAADSQLTKRLCEILKDVNNDKCIIAIPKFRTNELTDFWIDYYYENLQDISELLVSNAVYGNMAIFREGTVQDIERFCKIWDNKDAVIVIGEGSRFVFVPEILGNLRSIHYVHGRAKNAWSEYDKLLKQVMQKSKGLDNAIVLAALGPTATVLAYDLAINGIRSLDLGHVTNVYLRLTKGGVAPEKLPYQTTGS